jgi:hypothetical protein
MFLLLAPVPAKIFVVFHLRIHKRLIQIPNKRMFGIIIASGAQVFEKE